MVNMSFPTFPNCSITLSCSGGGGGGGGWDVPAAGGAAINWKFLTEAIVTRPLKFKHQHCNCSCHLGDLFFRTKGIFDFSLSGTSADVAAPMISENLELLNSVEWSSDFEKDMLRKESSRERGGRRVSG